MIKAIFILEGKGEPDVFLSYVPVIPVEGALACVDKNMYKVTNLFWNYSTDPKEEPKIVITLNRVD